MRDKDDLTAANSSFAGTATPADIASASTMYADKNRVEFALPWERPLNCGDNVMRHTVASWSSRVKCGWAKTACL